MNTPENKKVQFLNLFKEGIEKQSLHKLTLSKPQNKQNDLKSVVITLVKIKKGLMVNMVYHQKTQDITKNATPMEATVMVEEFLQNFFLQADMYLQQENIKLSVSPSGKTKLIRNDLPETKPVELEHNRSKKRTIETRGNLYLRELNVVSILGTVRPGMKDKYLQINRYIDLLTPALQTLAANQTIHVADMGSGKGYLTFALYDHMVNNLQRTVSMTGVEMRKNLVDQCNTIAQKSGFNQLHFTQGTILESETGKLDVLIALHACDTATDEAISKGIVSNSSLIVVAPCCQKQIRRQMKPSGPFKGFLKHGLFLGKQADIITDALRAMFLEWAGYKTKVVEFIDTEHTPKNLLIIAQRVKRTEKDKQKIKENIQQIKSLYGIEYHHLEQLLPGFSQDD
ncbi:MAG: class I SAM-dependent methyltransferase [Bacteroidota bacterium]